MYTFSKAERSSGGGHVRKLKRNAMLRRSGLGAIVIMVAVGATAFFLNTSSPKTAAITPQLAVAAPTTSAEPPDATSPIPSPATTAPIPSPATTAPIPSVPSTSSHANVWGVYATAVVPNPQVTFGSSSTGWIVTGVGVTSSVDDHINAGVSGQIWPGTGVARTLDGGRTWQVTLESDSGIWGVDAVNADDAWAVGVTTLYRSTNGGASWSVVGEPASGHLVNVAFTSGSNGVGLSTNGSAVSSTDGGLTWTSDGAPGGASGAFDSLCAQGSVVIAAGPAGDIWSQTNGGVWQLPFGGIGSETMGTYSVLNCGPTGAASEVVQPDEAPPGAGFWTASSISPSSSWQLLNSPSQVGSSSGPPQLSPASIAVSSPMPLLLTDAPATPAGAGVFVRSTTGRFIEATLPDLFNGMAPNVNGALGAAPALRSIGIPHITGVTFSDPQDGWLGANSQVQTPDGSTIVVTTIYGTTDRGSTWNPISQLAG